MWRMDRAKDYARRWVENVNKKGEKREKGPLQLPVESATIRCSRHGSLVQLSCEPQRRSELLRV